MSLSHFGLTPESDIMNSLDEGKKLAEWVDKQRLEQVTHFVRTMEWLPKFWSEAEVFFGTRYTQEDIAERYYAVLDIIDPLPDDIGNVELTEEEMELAEDCANFVIERMKQARAEREILSGYESEFDL